MQNSFALAKKLLLQDTMRRQDRQIIDGKNSPTSENRRSCKEEKRKQQTFVADLKLLNHHILCTYSVFLIHTKKENEIQRGR